MVVGSKINIMVASKAPFFFIVGKKATGQEVDGCSYKDNHRREGIRYANARPKVIIFCKSRPSDCQFK